MNDSFRADVLAIVSRIPCGKVVTYGQLAGMAGKPRAARLVGNIMRNTGEESLPCHRVIHSDGTLCDGFSSTIPGLQREMLRSEGVHFLSNGRVDLVACRWDGVE